MQPPVQWVTPVPLWTASMDEPARMQRPAVLRFDSDTFMEDLSELLARQPEQLGRLIATPKSFRAPPVGAPPDWKPVLTNLKLYQPVHGHFNLVAASLVCRVTGLPDRLLATSGEKVGFVLRRIAPTGEEMAWVDQPGQGKGWLSLAPGQFGAVQAFEQQLPVFPVGPKLANRKRRLLLGLIPTASRETFQAGSTLSPFVGDQDPATGVSKDPRLTDIEARVVARLLELKASTDDPATPAAVKQAKQAQEKEASLFILLDLAEFFFTNLPALGEALEAGREPAAADDAEAALHALLAKTIADTSAPTPLRWVDAVQAAWDQRSAITGEAAGPAPTLSLNLRYTDLDPAELRVRVTRAMRSPAALPLVPPTPPTVPQLDPMGGAEYVARYVFQRPMCGPFDHDVVSTATEPFSLASFFDSDAPARPIRITLPIDTSIGGLRKFNKNVAFVLSDQLQQQIAKATDLNKLLKGEFADSGGGGLNIGLICSFSIPIITICALLVLMIFLNLLNIIFWWMPFLRICFPILTPKQR